MKALFFPERMAFALYRKTLSRWTSPCSRCLPAEPHHVLGVQLLSQEGSHGGMWRKSLPQKLPLLLCTLWWCSNRNRSSKRNLPVLNQVFPNQWLSVFWWSCQQERLTNRVYFKVLLEGNMFFSQVMIDFLITSNREMFSFHRKTLWHWEGICSVFEPATHLKDH